VISKEGNEIMTDSTTPKELKVGEVWRESFGSICIRAEAKVKGRRIHG